MSASDKKKFRKEQASDMLTAKQREQQAEEKKLRVYTICFVTAMILIVCAVLGVVGVRAAINGGLSERFTVAATVEGEKLNAIEFSYYYNDAVSEFYNEWYEQFSDQTDTYLLTMGLDTSKPLDEQVQDEETGKTWAEYFVELALEEAKRDAALCNEAKKNGFELTEEQKDNIDASIENIKMWAPYYGFNDANHYMRATYGNGASLRSYRAYFERCQIADAYYDAHLADYTYTDEQMREYESKDNKGMDYNAFTYTTAYLSYTFFQQGGTEGENGVMTYTDAENDAARAAMKVAAETLVTATSPEDLKAKAAEVETKEGTSISVSNNKNQMYSQFKGANADLAAWIIDDARQEGDIDLIPINAKTTVDGAEVEVTNGYYVVIFQGRNEQTDPMGNVRHLLVKFEGGTEDEETGELTYSDEEKAAAKEEADGYLKTWKEGEATEATFIELVKEHSDDTSAEDGGLFEDIHPGSSYVENFLNWSIDPARKAGDAEVIETEYGYHVMYYVGDDDMSYRDLLVTTDMAAADQEVWYEALLEPVTGEVVDTSKLKLDTILAPAQ